jgi:hypothetical protein
MFIIFPGRSERADGLFTITAIAVAAEMPRLQEVKAIWSVSFGPSLYDSGHANIMKTKSWGVNNNLQAGVAAQRLD